MRVKALGKTLKLQCSLTLTMLINSNRKKDRKHVEKCNSENKTNLLSLINGNGRRMNNFALNQVRFETLQCDLCDP